jgi:putative transposase
MGYTMDNRYTCKNRRKYNLKVHIVLVTKYRKPLLNSNISKDIKQYILEICSKYNYEIIAIETDKNHVHLLVGYDTTDSVCEIVKRLKQETTYNIWLKYADVLIRHYWKRKIFWSDGYFACSIGEVSTATIQRYIETQG